MPCAVDYNSIRPGQTTAKNATCTEKEQIAKQSRGNHKKSEHNLRYAKKQREPKPNEKTYPKRDQEPKNHPQYTPYNSF
jgi:hypothetical protein